MLGPFSIDTPFPAFQQMGQELRAGTESMQLVVSAYLIAFGLMSPFHGPLSDALGRRPVILAGVGIYAGASLGCALAPSLPVLLGFRVLQGLSAGGGVIVSRTVIRDVFDGPQAQRLMSRVMMIFSLAPAVAPIVGGVLLQVGPWPVIFWFLTGIGLVLVAVVWLFLPETYPAEHRIPLAMGALVRTLVEVCRAASFHRVAWAAGLSFSGQFLYIGSAAIVVVDLLGRGELDFWMLFVPMIGGVMIGSVISSRAAGRVPQPLLISVALGVSLVGALVNVALAASPDTARLPYAVIGPAVIAAGTAIGYPAQQLTLLDMFPAARGAAVSMFTFFTLILNGTSAALAPLVTRSLLTMALAALALVAGGTVSWLLHLRACHRPRPVAGRR